MGRSILEEQIVSPAPHNTSTEISRSSNRVNQSAAAVVIPRPPPIKVFKSEDRSSITNQGSLAVGNSQTSRRRSSSYNTASTADQEEFSISKATPTTVLIDECARRSYNTNRGQLVHLPQVKRVSAPKPAVAAAALDGGDETAGDQITSRSRSYNNRKTSAGIGYDSHSAGESKTSAGSYINDCARASINNYSARTSTKITSDSSSSSRHSNRKRDRRGSLSIAGAGNGSDNSCCNSRAAEEISCTGRSGGAAAGVSNSTAGAAPLLPPLRAEEAGWRKTLVLDLDETLVHSSFKEIREYDFSIRVEMAAGGSQEQAAGTQPAKARMHTVYVRKRPGVEELLEAAAGELQYEVVVFTAGLKAYADAVLDVVDARGRVAHRLYRDSCRQCAGGLVKDLSLLGRDLRRVLILDNNPHCYLLHPRNALPVSSFFDNPHDRELLDLIPLLAALSHLDNIVDALAALGLAAS